MEIMGLNHWYVKENELSTSLMSFHVSIRIGLHGDDLFYMLTLASDNKALSMLRFDTLEDAVHFTEDVITRCYTKQQVIDSYNRMMATRVLRPGKNKEEK